MPLRHEIHQLILAGFREHGIDLPFPPFQMRLESLDGKRTARTLTSAGKKQQASGKFVEQNIQRLMALCLSDLWIHQNRGL